MHELNRTGQNRIDQDKIKFFERQNANSKIERHCKNFQTIFFSAFVGRKRMLSFFYFFFFSLLFSLFLLCDVDAQFFLHVGKCANIFSEIKSFYSYFKSKKWVVFLHIFYVDKIFQSLTT